MKIKAKHLKEIAKKKLVHIWDEYIKGPSDDAERISANSMDVKMKGIQIIPVTHHGAVVFHLMVKSR